MSSDLQNWLNTISATAQMPHRHLSLHCYKVTVRTNMHELALQANCMSPYCIAGNLQVCSAALGPAPQPRLQTTRQQQLTIPLKVHILSQVQGVLVIVGKGARLQANCGSNTGLAPHQHVWHSSIVGQYCNQIPAQLQASLSSGLGLRLATQAAVMTTSQSQQARPIGSASSTAAH